MKNIIILDTKNGLTPELSFDEGVIENIISIKIFNIGENPKIEIYYGCDFKELTEMEGNEFIVPSEYCADNEIIHFRYLDDETASNFIHIAGNESAYEDLKLVRKSNYLFCCDGKKKRSFEGTSDITIDEYLDILSKNPVTNEAITTAIVEVQNAVNTEKEKLASLGSSLESLQAKMQEESTSTDKAISGLNSTVNSMGQVLADKVDKVEGKGLSTNDYTTEEKEKLASLGEGSGNYETGTWTPDLYETSSSTSPTSASMSYGRYIKVGKLVYIRAYLSFNDAVSCYKITGLPFVSDFTSWPSQKVMSLLISRTEYEEKFKSMFCANNAVRNTGVLNDNDVYRESTSWMIEGFYLAQS